MKIMITGGAGYIGSHIALSSIITGHSVLIYDNFSNAGRAASTFLSAKGVMIVKGDVLDRILLTDTMKRFLPDLIIHAAGLKDAVESETVPFQYYKTNVDGTLTVLQAMEDANLSRIIFSSSAAVYGENKFQLTEISSLKPTSAYGRSKIMAEELIAEFSQRGRTAISLRYFNPVAAHPCIPQNYSNTFMSALTGAASGRRSGIVLYNEGYNVRDFIHILDLAEVHLRLENLSGHHVFNVGSGNGYKIKDVVKLMEEITNKEIPKTYCDFKREGDIEISISNTFNIQQATGWKTKYSLEQMCRDAWAAETLRL